MPVTGSDTVADDTLEKRRMRLSSGALESHPSLPVTVSSAILPDGLWGCYDAATEVILIDRRLTYTAKRCTLVHELLHWRHGDTSCDRVAQSREEHRARRETALTLIDPLRYGMLEQMYEGNSWNISQELEVTQQVLGDFRQVMAERVSII